MNNTNNKYDSVYTENPIRYKQNCSDSIDEKSEHNNKYNTIINIKSESPSQEFDSFKGSLLILLILSQEVKQINYIRFIASKLNLNAMN